MKVEKQLILFQLQFTIWWIFFREASTWDLPIHSWSTQSKVVQSIQKTRIASSADSCKSYPVTANHRKKHNFLTRQLIVFIKQSKYKIRKSSKCSHQHSLFVYCHTVFNMLLRSSLFELFFLLIGFCFYTYIFLFTAMNNS